MIAVWIILGASVGFFFGSAFGSAVTRRTIVDTFYAGHVQGAKVALERRDDRQLDIAPALRRPR